VRRRWRYIGRSRSAQELHKKVHDWPSVTL
jgi:hypothetical protein